MHIIKRKVLILLNLFIIGMTFAQKPNIVFIESDDQSNQAVGAYGNSFMKTPNIDKIAKEGVSFTAAYNMGSWSAAVCVPSRTMLFYGKTLWRSEKINKRNAPETFPELLKKQGYETYITGKWHAYGKNANTVFEKTGSIQPGQLPTYNSPNGHITDITGKEAAKYIKDYEGDKPFLLYVAFNAPHVPRQTKQSYYELYPTNQVQLPPSVVDGPLHPDIEYNYTSDPLKSGQMKKRVQQNNAMVTHMDDRIGDIIEELKKKGIYDNTIIVFMSDHGISFGENGVAGKVCLYEPSVTAPLIIKAPGIRPNTKIDERVYLQDVYPTLFDILNYNTPDYVEFKSLFPLLQNKGKSRNSIYLAMFDSQRAIITDNKKMILYPKTKNVEIYNLEKDPWETNNLMNSQLDLKIRDELFKEILQWQKQVDDKLDLLTAFGEYLPKK